jgi:hypothetical protein
MPGVLPSKNGQHLTGAYDGPMVTKKRAPVAVVTEGAAQAALRRGPARELSPDEEKVMRMRLGASPPRAAPLERVFEERTDLEIEVLAAEIEAFMKWRVREEEHLERLPARPQPSASPSFSRTKQKIIRALRRK